MREGIGRGVRSHLGVLVVVSIRVAGKTHVRDAERVLTGEHLVAGADLADRREDQSNRDESDAAGHEYVRTQPAAHSARFGYVAGRSGQGSHRFHGRLALGDHCRQPGEGAVGETRPWGWRRVAVRLQGGKQSAQFGQPDRCGRVHAQMSFHRGAFIRVERTRQIPDEIFISHRFDPRAAASRAMCRSADPCLFTPGPCLFSSVSCLLLPVS